MAQMLWFLITQCCTHVTHSDPACDTRSRKFFMVQAMFRVSTSLILRPPSLFGKQTSDQATFAPLAPSVSPLHRNEQHICSTLLITFFGNTKCMHQLFVMLEIIDPIN